MRKARLASVLVSSAVVLEALQSLAPERLGEISDAAYKKMPEWIKRIIGEGNSCLESKIWRAHTWQEYQQNGYSGPVDGSALGSQ